MELKINTRKEITLDDIEIKLTKKELATLVEKNYVEDGWDGIGRHIIIKVEGE